MARITVEDCLQHVDNRFGLIHLAAKRVRQLRKGAEPLVDCKNKDVVVSLREIAAGEVFPIPEDQLPELDAEADPALEALPETTAEVSSETPSEAPAEAPPAPDNTPPAAVPEKTG